MSASALPRGVATGSPDCTHLAEEEQDLLRHVDSYVLRSARQHMPALFAKPVSTSTDV